MKIVIWFLAFLPVGIIVQAQTTCDPSKFVGPNLVENGSFEQGDTLFDTDLSWSWNENNTGASNSYSNADEYYVGTSPNDVQPGTGHQFQSGWNSTASDGSNFFMADGKCAAVVWSQTITVEDSSNYFFSVDVTTLNTGNSAASVAEMRFKINGDTLGTITAPNTAEDGWVTFTQVYYSDTVDGDIEIEIIDENTSCAGPDEDDFGLDNIIFKLGCDNATPGPEPELGDDQTLCGTDGTITLDPGIPVSGDISIYWSTGVNDDDYTIDVTIPGTYAVCVDSAGSCLRADSIVISDDYAVSLPDPVELCSPASDTLDAGHSGTGVTYEWSYDDGSGYVVIGNQQTQFINQVGEYKVTVIDPTSTCGTVTDSSSVTIKSGAPNPSNIYFCNSGADTTVTLSVSGTGPFDWYANDSTTTSLASNTSTYTLANIDTTSDIYYVGTTATTNYTGLGPTEVNDGTTNPIWDSDSPNWYREFDALADLVINSVEMSANDYTGTCGAPGTASNNFTVSLFQNGVATGDSYTTSLICQSSRNNFETVPINFTVPKGTGYELRVSPFGGQELFSSQNVGDKAEQTTADVITFKEAPENFAGVFFNWDINASSPCDRAPVQAVWTCALPIQLLSFNGHHSDSGNVISWSTGSEENNSYFEIFRSYDGVNFESISIVFGQGDSFGKTDYSILDPIRESAYYRIISVDYDGAEHFGDQVYIFVNAQGPNIDVHYDRDRNLYTLTFDHEEEKIITVYALNAMLVEEIVTSEQVIEIAQNYPSGTYLLKISDHQSAGTERIYKE